MSDNFLPYVPDYVARDILTAPGAERLGVAKRFNAVTLFADVSGFTAISEALGKTGKIGTEELTRILNSYFEPMIRLIKTYGGIIGKFGGDAMTVMFPYDEHTQADAVRRAIQCGLDMQRDMVNYEAIQTSQGTYALAMKAGLGMGPIYTTIVGDPAVRLEFIIAGKPIDDCADAEHHASKGEVVVHDDLLPFAPDAEIAEPREGFSLIARLNEPVARSPLTPPTEISVEAADVLRQFLPPIIAERVQAGADEFIDEHRRTTVLFVSFTEQTYEDDSVGEVLQTYFNSIVNIVRRYDGYINKIDMGDKGSKYIILFGAPNAHENDEERALRCALEIAEVHGIKTRIGVNSGNVYSGRVGSSIRREYTVMGDAVNLSARLMQFAKPGQIIVSGLTREHMYQDPFTWEELESIMVKGKSEPIEVARLLGVSAAQAIALTEPEYALQMVGRVRELGQARELLARVKAGAGQIIGIQGEAGMGKSRLNAEIIRLALAEGFNGVGGAAQSFNTTLAYTAWQGVWRGFFGIDPAESESKQIETLETALNAINPDMLERTPLIGPVLGLDIPDNAFTETLDAAMRTDLRHNLLLECLRARSATGPLLLVLEDLHWMDPDSHELLAYLGRNIHDLPVLIVTVFRPPHSSEETSPVIEAVGDLAHFTLFNLSAFDHEEAEQLIRLKLDQLFGGQHKVSDTLTERIRQRAQGNPFYIEELINLLRDRNIDPTTADLKEFELPASLQQLILSRIDTLREDEKTVIKVASIIGRLFRASWVYGSYPEVGVPQFVIERLDRLGDLELTPMDRPEPELEYLFRHLLTQEVAYGTMAFSVRADLHERVGDFVEGRYEDTLQRYIDVLAYHFGQSDNLEKQRLYFRLAGDNAKRTYALKAAQYYYERLLPLLDEAEQGEVLLALGEVQQITGSWEQAEANFRRALGLAGDDRRLAANCQTALGDLLSYKEGYDEALNLLAEAQRTFEALGDDAGLNRVLKHLSFIYLRQGDYDQTRATAQRQIEVAAQAG
jgi:adenylate cyclase